MDKFDRAHMQTANVYARLSPAKRLKVGCILVKENRIVSIGYNGTPSGWSNECEYASKRGALTGNVIELKTKPEVLHAETNAIAKVARSFYGYELEHDESCFTPTTITKFTAINVPVEGKKVLDLGCGIGPLSVYYAKNGAKSVTAADVYDKHVHYTQLNAEKNGVDVEVIQSDLFENIDDKFDIISCDVSGVDRRVAELTGWFPDGVPTADETGADIICRAIKNAPP